jgi:hypothetical protein
MELPIQSPEGLCPNCLLVGGLQWLCAPTVTGAAFDKTLRLWKAAAREEIGRAEPCP